MKNRILIGLLIVLSFFASQSRSQDLDVGGGVPVYAIPQDKAEQVTAAWIQEASKYIGQREVKRNSSPAIDAMLKHVGLSPGYAYCMAYMQKTLYDACTKVGVRITSLAKGAACRDVARRTILKGKRLPNYMAGERGQLMCFRKPGTAFGHTGITTKKLDKSRVATIEGNTGSDGGRDGDGFYRKVRPINGYSSLRTEVFFVLRS